MENIRLSMVVNDQIRKKPAFKDLQQKSVREYLDIFYPNLHRKNNFYRTIFNICKNLDNIESGEENPSQNGICMPDESLPFLAKLQRLVEDIIKLFETGAYFEWRESQVSYLKDYYLNGLTKDQIREKNRLTSIQAIENHITGFKSRDNKKSAYLFFPDKFKEEMDKYVEKLNCRYLESTQDEIGFVYSEKNIRLLNLMGLDIIELYLKGNPRFIVNVNEFTKNSYRGTLTEILKKLKTCFSFITRDEMYKYFPVTIPVEMKNVFISNLVSSLNILEESEEGIRIKTEFLDIITVRQARIIYDSNESIRNDEIKKRYQEIYNEEMSPLRAADLNGIGFFCSGTEWKYGEKPINIRNFIKEYAESHIKFDYNELLAEIKNIGSNLNENSIETYTLDICKRSLDDTNIMVHKKHLKDFPNMRFAKDVRKGQTNIVLNAIWDYISDMGGRIAKNSLMKWMKDYLKQNSLYAGIAKQILNYDLFIVEDQQIKLNQAKYSKDDLRYLGLGKIKEKYANIVISLIVNELQKSHHKTLLFSNLQDIVKNNVGELNRNQILNFIKSEPDILQLAKVGGRLFVKLIKEIEASPVYEIKTTGSYDTQPVFVEVKEARERLSADILFNWDKLEEKMEKELEFYVRPYWFGMDFNLKSAIKKFRRFMESSDNANLSHVIPQNLYEYWFCSTSQYDRNRYFCDLARCYEPVLKELYRRNNAAMDNVIGLKDMCNKYYPDLAKAFKRNDYELNMSKVLRDLKYNRDKIAHGDYVEMSTLKEAQTISNYIALYVFTVSTQGQTE